MQLRHAQPVPFRHSSTQKTPEKLTRNATFRPEKCQITSFPTVFDAYPHDPQGAPWVAISLAIEVAIEAAIEVAFEAAIEVAIEVAIPAAIEVAIEVAIPVAIEAAIEVGIEVAMRVAIGVAMGVAIGATLPVAFRAAIGAAASVRFWSETAAAPRCGRESIRRRHLSAPMSSNKTPDAFQTTPGPKRLGSTSTVELELGLLQEQDGLFSDVAGAGFLELTVNSLIGRKTN